MMQGGRIPGHPPLYETMPLLITCFIFVMGAAGVLVNYLLTAILRHFPTATPSCVFYYYLVLSLLMLLILVVYVVQAEREEQTHQHTPHSGGTL